MKTYPMRARIRNEGSGPARVDIFDDIGAGGWFSEGYTPASFADAIKGVSGPLDVHINSGGGDVADGIAIASAIRAYPGKKRTVVDGMAASIASVIAQAGDERIVEPGAMLMIHDPLTACMGNQADFEKVAETLGKHGDNLAQQYAERSGTKSAAEWRDVMRAEAWYTADEAVAAGLADRVGSAEARLPQGIDVDALAAHAPARIMAQLRVMPRAAAEPAPEPYEGDGQCPTCKGKKTIRGGNLACPDCKGTGKASAEGAEDLGRAPQAAAGDETPVCLTCEGRGTVKHPKTGQKTLQCPGCQGTGLYQPDSDGDGMELGNRLRGKAGDEQLGSGWVRGGDGKVRFDPDGDGDDDSTPEGDTDHDYFDADGKEIKPIPPCPVARDSLAGMTFAGLREALRPVVRGWLADAGLIPGPGGFIRGAVDNSDWDGDKAMANGNASDDPAKFYAGICAGRKAGDASVQSSWALPYKYHPGDAPNAAGVRNALARLPQTQDLANEAEARKTLQAAMKQVHPDWEPEDSTDKDISAAHALERYRAALKGASA